MLVSGVQPSDSVIHTRIPKRKVLVAQPCPSLCNPMDCRPPGSSVPGTLQARILEWVAVPFSGDLPDPGIELRSPALQADSLPYEPLGKPIYMLHISYIYINIYIYIFFVRFFSIIGYYKLLSSFCPKEGPCY